MDTSIEKVKKHHAKLFGYDDVADFDSLMEQFNTKLATFTEDSADYKAMMDWKDCDRSKKGLLLILGE